MKLRFDSPLAEEIDPLHRTTSKTISRIQVLKAVKNGVSTAASTISIFFMFFNLYGFFASLLIICVLIKGSPLRWLFLRAVAAFSTAYLLALALITPDEKLPAILNIFFSASAMFIIPLAMEAWIHFKKRKGSQVTNGEFRVKGTVVTPHGLLA
ncbi:hypothetical protein CsSME_00049994 [Camellia sinensis var. sinensis]